MQYEKGTEVGAILNADEEKVYLLGYGTFDGEEIPPVSVNPMLNMCNIKNPKITLENGDVVWGCECWWGPKEKIVATIGDREVVTVSIEEARNRDGI